jgi:hypothetical protein
VTASELRSAGVSENQVQGLVRRGVLQPVFRGIYARADQAASLASSERGQRALRLAAAVAATGAGSAGSHHDAAILQGSRYSTVRRPAS